MAISAALNGRTVPGADTLQSVVITGDSSYPTGGTLLTPANVGLTVIKRVIECRPATVSSAVYVPIPIATLSSDGFSITSLKIACVVGTTGVEVANSTNLSAFSFNVIVEGN
jgi:hypothetical protein